MLQNINMKSFKDFIKESTEFPKHVRKAVKKLTKGKIKRTGTPNQKTMN